MELEALASKTSFVSPLFSAAKSGHERVVKLLLVQGDVSPHSIASGFGQTPLIVAAEHGHEGVVKLLLELEDINPNTVDLKYSRTPFLCAAERGHEGVVELLLGRGDVNPGTVNLSGKTALEFAESSGHTRVLELFSPPEPSPPAPVDIREALGHPRPLIPIHLQAHTGLSRRFAFRHRRPRGKVVCSFVIISSFVFLFCLLAVIILSLSTNSLLSFHM